MSYLLKKVTKKIFNNNIYSLQYFNNQIISNDPQGLRVFNKKLKLKNKIKLFSFIGCDYIFAPFSSSILKLLLINTEDIDDTYQVIIDLKTEEYIKINNNYLFSPVYYWDSDYLLLVNYQDEILKYDFKQQQMVPCKPIKSKKLTLFYKFLDYFCTFRPFAVDSKKYQFFSYSYETKNIEFIDLKRDVYLCFPLFPGIAVGALMLNNIPIIITEHKIYGWIKNRWKILLRFAHRRVRSWQQLTNSSFLLVTIYHSHSNNCLLEVYKISK